MVDRHRSGAAIGLALGIAGALGGALGFALATSTSETLGGWPGRGWVAGIDDARTALGGMLGIQLTLLGVFLTVTVFVVQNAVNQYSPRLLAFMTVRSPFRRVVVLFAFSASFTATAIWRLGFAPVIGPAPRPVIAVGALLLAAVAGYVLLDLYGSIRRIRAESIIRDVARESVRTVRRFRRHTHLATGPGQVTLVEDSAPAGGSSAAEEAVPIPASRTGYVIDVDARRLQQAARKDGLCARLHKTFGDEVVRGEPVGWLFSAVGIGRERAALALGEAVIIGEHRTPTFDLGLGLRVLADIADRALSPAVNDPYTAREALHQMRRILRAVAPLPLGWLEISGEGDRSRVSMALPSFGELLSVAVDGPSRYGAGDPDVVDGILDLAASVGSEVRNAEDRAAVQRVLERTLEDAAEIGKMDASRLGALRAKADVISRALRAGTFESGVVHRPAWAIAAPS